MTLKKIFSILVVTLLLIASYSCKKTWLDVRADKNQAVPTNLSDYQDLLDDYFTMNTERITLGEVASDGHYSPESAWPSATEIAKNAYTWSHNYPYNPTEDWPRTYSRIFQANVVLDGLKKITPNSYSDKVSWSNVQGQALFHRADAFFRLAQIWAPTYISTTADADLSIPLKLESDITLPSVRSTTKQTYDQILNDLLLAKDLLPVTPLYKTRPGKPAAFALLARVYLSMRDYNKAGDFADSCLKLYNSLLNYNTLPTNANFVGDFRTNPEVILHTIMATVSISSFLSTNCFIDPNLYAQYDSNDLRKVIFFKLNANGTITYKGNYNTSINSLFCGTSVDEMYFIRAESYARKGDVNSAVNDLNTVLATRWKSGTFIPFKANSADQALTLVLSERKKELLMRGLRWTDLRRLNQEDRFKVTLSRTIGGQTYTLEPNSYRYTFPIPDNIIAVSGMQQNPGWQ